ncbi:MAG: hypothetical protein KAQ85_09315, partial [Thermodesulfovibrionia bacterium]|nr:hypothetical protein [Thermodesulfovibrionia bacterium]
EVDMSEIQKIMDGLEKKESDLNERAKRLEEIESQMIHNEKILREREGHLNKLEQELMNKNSSLAEEVSTLKPERQVSDTKPETGDGMTEMGINGVGMEVTAVETSNSILPEVEDPKEELVAVETPKRILPEVEDPKEELVAVEGSKTKGESDQDKIIFAMEKRLNELKNESEKIIVKETPANVKRDKDSEGRDDLFELVRSKQKIKVKDAVKELGSDNKLIKKWANELAGDNLINMSSSFLNGMTLELAKDMPDKPEDSEVPVPKPKEEVGEVVSTTPKTEVNIGGMNTPEEKYNVAAETPGSPKTTVDEGPKKGIVKKSTDDDTAGKKSLFKLIQEERRIKLRKAATELGVDRKLVRKWANELSEKERIDIHSNFLSGDTLELKKEMLDKLKEKDEDEKIRRIREELEKIRKEQNMMREGSAIA